MLVGDEPGGKGVVGDDAGVEGRKERLERARRKGKEGEELNVGVVNGVVAERVMDVVLLRATEESRRSESGRAARNAKGTAAHRVPPAEREARAEAGEEAADGVVDRAFSSQVVVAAVMS